MGCYSPIYMIDQGLKDNGKKKLIFATQVSSNLGLSIDELKQRYKDRLVPVPCGKCLGCQLDHAKEWSVRCVLESLEHSDNCFITLTYDDMHCPKKLVKDHLSSFMKRLRARHPSVTIRFFGCGEYGSINKRPHYHAILFGYDFPDKEYFTDDGISALYRSKELESLWTYGISSIGEVTIESCSYVARYSNKKTGCGFGDEFLLMSRRPGIAYNWFIANQNRIYLSDHVYGNFGKSHVASVPRYFDKLAEIYGHDLTEVKQGRVTRAQFVTELSKALYSCGHTEDLNIRSLNSLISRIKTLRRYI